MFFGRKNENFEPDQLEALLNESFEKKLGSFKSRSEGIANGLRSVQNMFSEACDKFDAINTEPNMENLFWMNANQIKKQKGSYAKALKNVVQKSVESRNSTNSYDKYKSLLSNAENMNKEILETNSTFKNVLYCYSHHIGDFKRASLQLERLLLLLGSELDKKSKEYEEYKSLGGSISKLYSYGDELAALHDGIEAIGETASGRGTETGKESEHEILENLKAKKTEYTNAEKDEIALSNRIHLQLSPLGRASKKFDHAATRKVHLSYFIEAPFERIRSDAEYKEFTALVIELKESLNSGVIDIKNKDEVIRAIEEILASDFHYRINSFTTMHERRIMIGEEVRMIERTINRIAEVERNAEKRAMEIKDMEKNMASINVLKGEEKRVIEKKFLQYYGRTIAIK